MVLLITFGVIIGWLFIGWISAIFWTMYDSGELKGSDLFECFRCAPLGVVITLSMIGILIEERTNVLSSLDEFKQKTLWKAKDKQ